MTKEIVQLPDEDLQIVLREDLDDEDLDADEPAPEGIDDIEDIEPDEEEEEEEEEEPGEEEEEPEGVDIVGEVIIDALLAYNLDVEDPTGQGKSNIALDLASAFAAETDAWDAFKRLVKYQRTADVGLAQRSLPDNEEGQIEPRADLAEVKKLAARRSDRPIQAHADLADKFLECRKAIDQLNQQAAAVRAIISEKERVAGTMAGDLMRYAEEYAERMYRTKKILIKLEDIAPHRAQVPQYKKVIDHLLQKLESVSANMRKEAEEFINAAHSEVPGRTELLYKELESKAIMGEAWAAFKRILARLQIKADKSSEEISFLESELAAMGA